MPSNEWSPGDGCCCFIRTAHQLVSRQSGQSLLSSRPSNCSQCPVFSENEQSCNLASRQTQNCRTPMQLVMRWRWPRGDRLPHRKPLWAKQPRHPLFAWPRRCGWEQLCLVLVLVMSSASGWSKWRKAAQCHSNQTIRQIELRLQRQQHQQRQSVCMPSKRSMPSMMSRQHQH